MADHRIDAGRNRGRGCTRGALQLLHLVGFGLAYPLALRYDAKYIGEMMSEWKPGPTTYTGIDLLVFPLTVGVLSFVVSPVYLFRRRKYVP